jgi:hypothetical protein
MLSTLEKLLVTSLNTDREEPKVEAVLRSHLRFITDPGISLRVMELTNDLPDPHEAKDMLLRQPVVWVTPETGLENKAAHEKEKSVVEDAAKQQSAVAGYEETVPARISLEIFAWEKSSAEADALFRPALAQVLAEFVRQEVIALDPAEDGGGKEQPALAIHFCLYNPVAQVRQLEQTVQAIKDSQLYWYVSGALLVLSADLRMSLQLPDEVPEPERIGKISGQVKP